MVTLSNRFVLVFVAINLVEVNVSENADAVARELQFPHVSDDSIGFVGKRSPVQIKKCCPWGAFFDVNTLTCELSSKTGNFTREEIKRMERSFAGIHTGESVDGDYQFSIGVFPCNGTKVFTSQVTTQFTLESGIPKLEGKRLEDEYCIDDRNGKGTVLLRCQHDDFCKNRPCIRKCKPFGEFFGREDENGEMEIPRMTREFYNLDTMKVDSLIGISSFGLYMGSSCEAGEYSILEPEEMDIDRHYLGSNGKLHIPEHDQQYYTNEEFCIEYVKGENQSQVYTFVCFPNTESHLKYYIYSACMIVSCIFLLATFLVYIFTPKVQTVYGKSLMCYIACWFCAYLNLIVIQFDFENVGNIHCALAGYITLFSLLAAFFWMNIMAVDMWKSFRSTRLARFNRSKGKIQFLWYSLYVWTITSLLTGVTAACDFIPNLVPEIIKPGFGEPDCWFSRYSRSIHVFFISPVCIVTIVNTILFIDTAWRCWKVKSKINRMGNQSKKKYAANKTQLIINLKLFIAMGVVWSLEVISWFYDHPIWYISDIANALHGVFIFAVFVMKKKVLGGLHHRIRKPFMRMKNIRKRSLNESGVTEETITTTTTATKTAAASGKKLYGRSSSTNYTDISI